MAGLDLDTMPLDRACNTVFALMVEDAGPFADPRKVREKLEEVFASVDFEVDPEGFIDSEKAREQEEATMAAVGAPARRRDE